MTEPMQVITERALLAEAQVAAVRGLAAKWSLRSVDEPSDVRRFFGMCAVDLIDTLADVEEGK